MRSFVAPRRRPPARLQGAIQNEPVSPKVRTRGARPGHQSLMRPAIPEQIIQRAVCQHLRQRGAAGLVWWHTPNGGRRSPIEAAVFAGLGVRAGVFGPDLAPRRQSVCSRAESRAGPPKRRPNAIHLRVSRCRRRRVDRQRLGSSAAHARGVGLTERTRSMSKQHCVVDNTKGLEP